MKPLLKYKIFASTEEPIYVFSRSVFQAIDIALITELYTNVKVNEKCNHPFANNKN